MANLFKQLQAQDFYLAGAGVSIGATTITLNSMLDIEGATIAMTDLGSKGYATIEPGNGVQEEAITFTDITQNVNGTATLTGVKHQLFKDPYTETSGLTKSHTGGTILRLTNTAGFYENFLRLGDNNTVADVITFTNPNYPQMDTATPAPSADAQLATKKYVDDTAIAGAPKATDTVYGIAKLSSAASVPATPTVLNSEEVSATSGNNKVVRANGGGKIDIGFINAGTSANQIVQLDASAKLPAVDGSNLTLLNDNWTTYKVLAIANGSAITGTSLTTVLTYTIPAGALSTKHSVRFVVNSVDGDNSNRTMTFNFGSKSLAYTYNPSTTSTFTRREVVFTNTSATAQTYGMFAQPLVPSPANSNYASSDNGTHNQNTANTVTVSITIQGTASNSATTFVSAYIEFIPTI